jgi:hypothetical protein
VGGSDSINYSVSVKMLSVEDSANLDVFVTKNGVKLPQSASLQAIQNIVVNISNSTIECLTAGDQLQLILTPYSSIYLDVIIDRTILSIYRVSDCGS